MARERQDRQKGQTVNERHPACVKGSRCGEPDCAVCTSTKLVYEACDCIKRGHAYRPGSVGILYAVQADGDYIFVADCPKCGL